MKTVLLLEDNANVSKTLTDFLETKGYRVLSAVKVEPAIKLYEENEDDIDYVFTDYDLKPENGEGTPLDLLLVLKEHGFSGRTVAISGDESSNEILKMNGCSDICAKPFDFRKLSELLT